MRVRYSDKVPRDSLPLLEQATRTLETILDRSVNRVTAEWDRLDDEAGQPVYQLRLADKPDEATRRFTYNELTSPTELSFRLSFLWDEVLANGSWRLLDQMEGMKEYYAQKD